MTRKLIGLIESAWDRNADFVIGAFYLCLAMSLAYCCVVCVLQLPSVQPASKPLYLFFIACTVYAAFYCGKTGAIIIRMHLDHRHAKSHPEQTQDASS